jgi:hypothetical protein
MWSALIDSFNIIAASVNNPFQEKILIRHLGSTTPKKSEAFSGILGNNNDDLKEFNKYLQGQVKTLQEMVEKHEKINLSRTYQFIIFFCFILIVAALAGTFLSSTTFNDPINYAQKNLIDTCNFLLKTLLPALVGLISGKLIK